MYFRFSDDRHPVGHGVVADLPARAAGGPAPPGEQGREEGHGPDTRALVNVLQHITLHHITSHLITLHHITSHYITRHYITSHHITLYDML